MIEELRQSPRIALDVQVDYGTNAIGYSKDISEGGICPITEHALKEGETVKLAVYLPGRSRPIESSGTVRWARTATEHLFENGVTFWDIEEKDLVDIKKYLEIQGE